MIIGRYWSSTRSICNQYVDSYKALLIGDGYDHIKKFSWVKMVETSRSQETNNSDLLLFCITLMIYDENVKVPNFSQSAGPITEWVI